MNGLIIPTNVARLTRVICALLAGLLFGALMLVNASAAQGESASLLKGTFRGNAYGTYANAQAGQIAAELGKSAYQPCPCEGTGGKVRSNRLDSLIVGAGGKILRANEILSTVRTDRDASSAVVRNANTISGLNLLDGLITADAIKAVANTTANQQSIQSSSNGSTFVNLKVDGKPVAAGVPANTRIDLPGLGSVLLKSVKNSGNGTSSSGITVEMITIVVTKENDFGLPVGAKIIVGHAASGFTRSDIDAVVKGVAYAADGNAKIGKVLHNKLGKAAFLTLPCQGTRGKTITNNIAALSAGKILTSGTGTTTGFGGPTSNGTVAKTTATVKNLNLLDGLITAGVIRAVAQDTLADGVRTSSTEGSLFRELRIAGALVSIGDDVAPNTRVDLPGIGFVIINEQLVPEPSSTRVLQVNGLRLVVTNADNLLDLPVGAQITVAHARTSIVPAV